MADQQPVEPVSAELVEAIIDDLVANFLITLAQIKRRFADALDAEFERQRR
jgi:hypothetical protein